MAPRKAASGIETKEVLSAVVLADSFTQRFRPMTVERPKALLPLVNVPMITYTLEWLVASGVEEIYVFCCAHAAQVEAYLQESHWLSERHCKVSLVVSTNCRSAGEALRVIDQKDIIKADFVLVSADTVSNMDLGAAVRVHKARRAADKNAIMTMVMRSTSSPTQRRRVGDGELSVVVDPATQQLLKYEDVRSRGGQGGTGDDASRGGGRVAVETQLFSERDAAQVRSDLLDCQVYICAPEVLMLFQDNFDYQNVRREFVTGVLSEEELGNKIFVYELQGEYAARVCNLRAYDAISRDVLQRWSFPFTPDTNLLRLPPPSPYADSSTFTYSRGNVYREHSVKAARSAKIGRDTCIGANTEISKDAEIECSVIGRNCSIGQDSVISGSYIHDDVLVHDSVTITNALVCEGAVIKEGAIIEPGAVVGFKVVIGEGHTLEAHERVSLCKQRPSHANESDDELEYAAKDGDDDDNEDDEEQTLDRRRSVEPNAQPSAQDHEAAEALAFNRKPQGDPRFDEDVVGPDGAGYRWDVRDAAHRQYSVAPPPPEDAEEEDDADSDDDRSITTAAELEREEDGLEAEGSFKREVAETFLRCKQQGFDQDNAVIELNSLKIAEDRTFAEVARYVFITILGLCLPAAPRVRGEYRALFPEEAPDTETKAGKAELLAAFGRHLAEWGPMLQRFLRDEDDQVELVLTFEEFCADDGEFAGERGSAFAAIFPQVLKELYDGEVLSEEAILQWADEKAEATEEERVFLNRAAPLVQWLRTAESDEEGEEGDDEDDDSD